jgi:YesN/AraC family two-component response regulator
VGAVARAVGYADPNYFAKVFKRHCGRRPRDVARAAR